MFLERLLRPFLINLIQKKETHPFDMILQPPVVFEEPPVPEGFKDESMDLNTGLEITSRGLASIRSGGLEFLADRLCFRLVQVTL